MANIGGSLAASAVDLFDAFDVAVVVTDLAGSVVEWNAAAERLYGYAASDAVGALMRDLVFDPTHLAIYEKIATRLRAGERWEGDVLARRGDGPPVLVRLSQSPLFDDHGNRIGGVGLAVPSKRASGPDDTSPIEEVLPLFDSILETAPVGFSFFDSDLRYVRLNRLMASFDGRSPEDHVGRTIAEVLGPAAGAVEAVVREVFDTGRPVLDQEIDAVTTGDVRSWRASYYPVGRRDGEVLWVGAVVTEETDRRRAEVDRARLLAAEQAARADAEAASGRLAVLAQSGAIFAATLDDVDALRRLARLAVPVLGDWCAIHVVDDDGTLSRLAVATDDASIPAELDEGPVAQVLHNAEPLLLNEPATDHPWAAAGVRSAVVVPLRARGRTVGAVTLAIGASGRTYQPADLTLVAELARRAALALINARRFQREHAVADTLQRALLPSRLPDIPGVTLVGRYVAGSVDVDIGGDWYDAISLPGGAVALVVGDVMGHDVGAAAAMGQLRAAVRVLAADDLEPAVVCGRLNRLIASLDTDRLTTLVYARLDPSEGELRLACAGHPPPVVIRPDGAVETLPCGSGVPLAGLPDGAFEEAVVQVERGSTLLLYTDGLVERRDSDLDTGIDRLRAAAAALASASAATLADRILGHMLPEEERQDDVALLVVRLEADG